MAHGSRTPRAVDRGFTMERDFHDDTSDVLDALLEQHRAHAIILLDPLGRVVDWLAGAGRIFGWSVDEIQGQMLERLFTPEDRARGVARQELRIAETTGDAPDDRWQLRKNGSRVWVEGVLTALRNRAGNITGYAKIVRNRTESRG